MKKTNRLFEGQDDLVFFVSGKTINQIRIDYSFTLGMWERVEDKEYDIFIQIKGSFLFVEENNQYSLSLESRPPTEITPALSVLHKKVISMMASREGDLEIKVEGAIISVKHDDQYEAWEVNDSEGRLIVSIPGGALSIWENPS